MAEKPAFGGLFSQKYFHNNAPKKYFHKTVLLRNIFPQDF